MQAEAVGTRQQVEARGRARSDTLIAAAMAALLGGFLLWGVGFSHIMALHNAAHDVRHSMAFPCH